MKEDSMTNKITIVGLGAGDLDQLPVGIYRLLKQNQSVFLRTKEHPAVRALEEEGFSYQSFDGVYESFDSFDDVYESITKQLLEQAKNGNVLYAVPGHPLVAERTVQLLLQNEEGIEIDVKGGQSFQILFLRH